MMALHIGFGETERDREVILILTRMHQFPEGSAHYQRIQRIWHEASLSGALRENFPPGSESIARAWQQLVAECRKAIV